MQLSKATGGFPIAPVGMVWKEIREKFPTIDLYAPDQAHPSQFGSYVAACTFYTSIYKESPIDAFYPKKVEDTEEGVVTAVPEAPADEGTPAEA